MRLLDDVIVESGIIHEEGNVFHILPSYGAPGFCAAYDRDCLEMTAQERIVCATNDQCPDEGLCPFADE